MFGDEALGEMNIRMVQVAQSVGAACKFTGSGGAAIAFCPNGESQVRELEDACKAAGFTIAKAVLGPSFVTVSSQIAPE
jgi:glucuronokinase